MVKFGVKQEPLEDVQTNFWTSVIHFFLHFSDSFKILYYISWKYFKYIEEEMQSIGKGIVFWYKVQMKHIQL